MARSTNSLLPAIVLTAYCTLTAEAATDADRITALEEQLAQQKAAMQQQQRMIEAMDAELKRLRASAAAPSPAPASATQVVGATATGATPAQVPKNPLAVNVYGFAQADAVYDFNRVDPDWQDTLRVSTIPTTEGTYGNDGNFTFGVRQSRLGLQGKYGDDVSFKLEAELFGVGADEGQTTIRLRHAWASYRNFGMGQTWSNFMDIDIFPNTVDYWGPPGMVFYRNQQARYTVPMGDDEFSIGIEDPGTALTVGRFRDASNCDLPNAGPDCVSTGSTASDLFQAHNDVPDLAMRYRNNGDFGHFQIAGIVRKLGYERLDNGNEDYETGWGVNTSAGIKTLGKDVLKLQAVYGEGIGNYMNDGGLDIAPDSRNIVDVDAEAVPTLGVSAYYDHYWSDRWSTSLGWSVIDLDTSSGQGDDEFAKGQIAQINLLYYPMDHVLLGTEYIWGEREDFNGNTGSDSRIQFTMRIDFDTGDLLRR
jgi:uncharacterized coiled-coil protein SlyX